MSLNNGDSMSGDIARRSALVNEFLKAGRTTEALREAEQFRDWLLKQDLTNTAVQEALQNAQQAIGQLKDTAPASPQSRKTILLVGAGLAVVFILILVIVLSAGHRVKPGPSAGPISAETSVVSQPAGATQASPTPASVVPGVSPTATLMSTPGVISPPGAVAIVPPPVPTSTPAPLPSSSATGNSQAAGSSQTMPITSYPVASNPPAVSPEYLTAAKQAFDAIRAMTSIVDVGISYRDYPSRLQDCQIVVDRFLQDHPQEQIHGINRAMKLSLEMYNDAGTVWGIKFEGDGVEHYVENGSPMFELICRKYPNLRADANSIPYCSTEYGYNIDGLVSIIWGYADQETEIIHRLIKTAE